MSKSITNNIFISIKKQEIGAQFGAPRRLAERQSAERQLSYWY